MMGIDSGCASSSWTIVSTSAPYTADALG